MPLNFNDDVLDLTKTNVSGLAQAAGTPNVESDVLDFSVPNRTWYKLRGNITTISLQLQNAGGTAAADSSRVRITLEDPNGKRRDTLLDTTVVAIKEFQDRTKILVLGQDVIARPQDVFRVLATADVTIGTANTLIRLGSVKRRTF